MNSSFKEIDTVLRGQDFPHKETASEVVYRYAGCIAEIEKVVVVVSDLRQGSSRIFHGSFSAIIGLNGECSEQSIWERDVFSRMSPAELDEKFIAELRFYNYLRGIPRNKRDSHYLATHLRMADKSGNMVDVLHRMHYWYENMSDSIRFGICIYGPLVFSLPAKSIAVNSLTGKWEALTSSNDNNILSPREKQVLALIEQGYTSMNIAGELSISKNTVSRHRQEILAKLQVKNSTEACRRAKQLGIII